MTRSCLHLKRSPRTRPSLHNLSRLIETVIGDPDPSSAGTAGDAALWGGSSAAMGRAATPSGPITPGQTSGEATSISLRALLLVGARRQLLVEARHRNEPRTSPNGCYANRLQVEFSHSNFKNQISDPRCRVHNFVGVRAGVTAVIAPRCLSQFRPKKVSKSLMLTS